jgi:hypothetical protein
MGAIRPPVPACFSSTPAALQAIDPAHAPPAVKAAINRARAALTRARR